MKLSGAKIFTFMIIISSISFLSSCSSDKNPVEPENNCSGVEKTIDSTFVLDAASPIFGIHVYDADKDCDFHMTVKYYWDGEDVIEADTVWEPPVICNYDIGDEYIKIDGIKKIDSNGKYYWEAILDGNGSKSTGNPIKLSAGSVLYYLNVPNVRTEVSLTYKVYNK